MTSDVEELTRFPDHFVAVSPEIKYWYRDMMRAFGLICLITMYFYFTTPDGYYQNSLEVDQELIRKTIHHALRNAFLGFATIWLLMTLLGRNEVATLVFKDSEVTVILRNNQELTYKIDELRGFTVLKNQKMARNKSDQVSIADYSTFRGYTLFPEKIYGFLLYHKITKKWPISLPLLAPLNYARMLIWLQRRLPDISGTANTSTIGKFKINEKASGRIFASLIIAIFLLTTSIWLYNLHRNNYNFTCSAEQLQVNTQKNISTTHSCSTRYDIYNFIWDLFTQKLNLKQNDRHQSPQHPHAPEIGITAD